MAKVEPLLAHFPELKKAVEIEVPGSWGPSAALQLADLLIRFAGWKHRPEPQGWANLACWIGVPLEMNASPRRRSTGPHGHLAGARPDAVHEARAKGTAMLNSIQPLAWAAAGRNNERAPAAHHVAMSIRIARRVAK